MKNKLKEIVDIIVSRELIRKGTYIGYEKHFVKLVSECVRSVYGNNSAINVRYNMYKACFIVEYYDSNIEYLNEIEVKFTYNKVEDIKKCVIEYINIIKLN